METDTCSKCGSPLESGQISINASPFWEIGFKPDSEAAKGLKRFFSSSHLKNIQASACSNCGHVELRLVNAPGKR
jgi:hypothetical protein